MGTILTQRAAPPASLAWLVWGLGALLYLVAFYQRVAPAVITQELSREFGLSAAALGNLSAFYFYSYVAVQIPTGLLADRSGPRRVLAAGAALTALGTLLFAFAPSVAWAMAGRLAIGAAAGVAFVSMLKLASHWMPFSAFAFVSGAALVVGVIGATLAGAPLRIAVDAIGWRAVMAASAAACAVAAVAIWLVVRDDPVERGYATYHPAIAGAEATSISAQLREVLRHRNTWLVLLIPGAYSGIVLTFAGLWGVPYLVTQYGFTTRSAALVCTAMLVAWSVPSLAYGPLSQKLGRRKPVFIAGLVATLALWSVVIFVRMPPALLVLALVLVAIAAASFVLVFAFAKESVPSPLSGTAVAMANMGVMLGGMVMQPLVGIVLDRHWDGAMAGGVRAYSFEAYQGAFALMLAWGVVALALLLAAKETSCHPFEARDR